MTNTRIDHSSHNHPATATARRACRAGADATPTPIVLSPLDREIAKARTAQAARRRCDIDAARRAR